MGIIQVISNTSLSHNLKTEQSLWHTHCMRVHLGEVFCSYLRQNKNWKRE